MPTTFWDILIPAASGIAGVVVGGVFTRSNDKRKQKLEFVAQQLREFYAPLLGLRTHIRSMSELRERISATADGAWMKLVDEAQQSGGVPAVQALRQQRFPEFQAIIQFDNTQFRSTLHPLYKEMLAVFRDKYWLAQPSTRPHYATLLEFVELWERHLHRTLPPEVVVALGVREKVLEPLYENLGEQFEWLQTMLQRAEV
jgi:hypothetical protein